MMKTLLCVLALIAVPHAQQSAQPATAVSPPISTVPRSVPFTGQLVTEKGDARRGSVLLTFGLYTEQKDSTPIWTEQQLVTLDDQGRYSAILGSISPDGLPADAFAAGTPRWLGVQVEGEAEQPRFMLLSVPYALKAGDADTVGGKAVTELVTASHLTESVKSAIKESTASPNAPFVTPNALVKYQNSSGTQTESSVIDAGGRLGIGVNQGTVVSDNSELDILGAGSTTTITMHNGANAADVVKLVGFDGSLRIGSATTANLVNLIGPNVGIGTTTPSAALHVGGAQAGGTSFLLENVSGQSSRRLFLSNYGTAGGGLYWAGLDSANTSSLWGPNLFVLRADAGLVFSGSSMAEHMRIDAAGRVLINNTVGASYRLDVNADPNDLGALFAHTAKPGGIGIFASSGSTTGFTYGVIGEAFSVDGIGVFGLGGSGTGGIGVRGEALGPGAGIEAVNHGTSGFADGLRATSNSPDAVGIWARNLAANGTAGRFDGNVSVNGELSKSSGSFKIDHPLDPENQYLYHSFVESPDMMNIYNGIVTTDAKGEAAVTLPDWFQALNSDFRYQLTCIGTFAQAIVAEEVTNNRFAIKTSAPGVKVSWQITGIRQDAWARQHRVPVEEPKPATERGTYLHPDVFNQPEEKGIDAARRATSKPASR